MYIQNYSCTTAAGVGTPALMSALYSGKDCSVVGESGGRVCYLKNSPEKNHSYRDIFVNGFKELVHPLREGLSKDAYLDLTKNRMVLIFASNKGALEDYIWTATKENIREMHDPYSEILTYFQENSVGLPWIFDCTVANACISTHAALEYTQDLFKSERAEYALIISGELVGPFLEKGYDSLRALSHTSCRPFAEDRDGMQLGEALAMMLISRDRKSPEDIKIQGVVTKTQGIPHIPPEAESQTLLQVLQELNSHTPVHPDLVVAHGSGTQDDDAVEDEALVTFLDSVGDSQVPITSTKWCIGNSLGASGLIDIIAAAEVLKTQKVFRIHNTSQISASMKAQYLLPHFQNGPGIRYRQILITSLAFTGVYAACAIGVEEVNNENPD
ncbi:beta-ketoacyl synthase N-terminal-like domain-containing protein [Bdellovibrio sp. HCB290]|uniref:beta-ketoacyl synthase N-terminal-like domain-containing protein n=1 Tax=Bdellovibrio sp. HCB290 TaxID=3394356 RepID=UPI0039B3EDA8